MSHWARGREVKGRWATQWTVTPYLEAFLLNTVAVERERGRTVSSCMLLFALWKIGLWCRFCSPLCFVSDAGFSRKTPQREYIIRTRPRFSPCQESEAPPPHFSARAQLIKNDIKRKQEKVEKDVSTPHSNIFYSLDQTEKCSAPRNKSNQFKPQTHPYLEVCCKQLKIKTIHSNISKHAC